MPPKAAKIQQGEDGHAYSSNVGTVIRSAWSEWNQVRRACWSWWNEVQEESLESNQSESWTVFKKFRRKRAAATRRSWSSRELSEKGNGHATGLCSIMTFTGIRHNTRHQQFWQKQLLVKQLHTVLPVSLSQEYATLNWVYLSVGTGVCPAITKFQVGVAGTTIFRPCTRVKVRITLNQCLRVSTKNEPRGLFFAWTCGTLPFSSPSVIEFGLHRYHDSVWMPLDKDFCNTGTCSGLLCWWACTSGAKHNQAKSSISSWLGELFAREDRACAR